MASTPSKSLFDDFDILEVAYKTVQDHAINANVITSKNLQPGSHPVLLNIHGGFFMLGHATFESLFLPWTLELALKKSAIVVSADHRLLPSTNGLADVLEDLEDLWNWLHNELPALFTSRFPGHSLDFSKVLLTGASAGGYGVTQLALSHPDQVSAVAIIYPLIDTEDPIWVQGPTEGDPTVLNIPRDQIVSKDAALAWAEERKKTITTKAEFEIFPYAAGFVQHGLFKSHILDNKGTNNPGFNPLKRIENGATLPKAIWLVHGDADSATYIRSSHKFVSLVHDKLPETFVKFDIAAGADHGFDGQNPDTWQDMLSAPGGMDFIVDAWLRE